MADNSVAIAVDPIKQRLKAVKAKLNGAGTPGKKLTAQEIEDTLNDILDHLGIN